MSGRHGRSDAAASSVEDRRAKRRGRIVISAVLIVLLAAIGGGGAYAWSVYGERISLALGWTTNDYSGDGHGEALVTVLDGQLGSDVAATLEAAGVVKTSQAFYELLLAQPENVNFQVGTYRLRLQMSAQAALSALQDPASRVQLTAMIPEGLTVAQTLKILSSSTGIALADLEAAAADVSAYGLPAGVDSLEGWLFPATYEFEFGGTAADAISLLVEHQKLALDRLGVAEADRQRVLTFASIVQKESGHAEDFGKVARVIQNRLDIGMLLQMDSTAQFGMGEHDNGSVWTSDQALADDNPWNTYKHKGLPKGPIASPGSAAVEAALNPTPGDWLYFVVAPGKTGKSTFSVTGAEHEKAVAEYREWCAKTPNSGC